MIKTRVSKTLKNIQGKTESLSKTTYSRIPNGHTREFILAITASNTVKYPMIFTESWKIIKSKERLPRQAHSFPPCRAQSSTFPIYVSTSIAFPQLYHNCLPNLDQTDYVALSLYFVFSDYDFQIGEKTIWPLKKSVLISSWILQNRPKWLHENLCICFLHLLFQWDLTQQKWHSEKYLVIVVHKLLCPWESSDVFKIPKLVFPLILCIVLLYIS